MRLWKGIRIQFFFDKKLRDWSKPQLASLKLLSRGKRYHKIDSKDLLTNNVLRF